MSTLSSNKNPQKSQINNSGIKQLSKLKLISSIKTAEPFKTIFPINAELLNTIVEDMKDRGFDESQPLLLWKEEQVLIDGHTRLKAATDAGIQQLPIHEKSFTDENEAVEYVIHLQKDRRNLTDAELYKCICELDTRYTRGGYRRNDEMNSSSELFTPNEDEDNEKSSGPSREKTASVVGTSSTKVQKVRTINDNASEEIKQAVVSGKYSINQGYEKTQEKRKQKKPAPKRANLKHKVYWTDSTLLVEKNEEPVVVLELKLKLNEKVKEQIKKAVETHSE